MPPFFRKDVKPRDAPRAHVWISSACGKLTRGRPILLGASSLVWKLQNGSAARRLREAPTARGGQPMKRVEDPELFDPQSINGHVTLYDGRGRVLGYVDI
jgi:hypothetical protein